MHARSVLAAVLLCTSASAADFFGPAFNVPGVDKKGQSVAVDGKTLYCGAGETLYVFDISEPARPRLLSSLGGFGGLRQMQVADGLLAVSSRGAGAWLVDVSSPSSPKLLSHYDSVEQATGIEIAGNLMFIGQRGTGVEIVDITDRTRPEHIRTVKTPESQTCRYESGMFYSGDWHSGEVNAIDVSDLSNARIIGKTEMHGFGDGFDIEGKYIYGSTGHHRIRSEFKGSTHPENFGKGHGVEIWDRSDATKPKFVSRVDFPTFWRIGNDMWTCHVSDGWLFCSDTYNGLFAVDVHDPANPKIVDRFCDKNPKDAEAPSRCISYVAVGDGAVYATSDGGGLWAIPCEKAKFRPQNRGKLPPDAKWREPYTTPEGSHFRAWQPPTRGQVHSVAAYKGALYVGCSYAGAFVVDARTLKTLARIPCKYARDVAVRNGKLYVAQGDDGIGVYSLEDPAKPKEVRRISEIAPGVRHCEWLYVYGDRWVVCHPRRNSGTWYFLDISKDPAVFAGKAPGMDWVRPFADELVGGKWLGYAQTHRFFKWYDMSGDKPTLIDTEDTSLTGPIQQRPNYIRTQSCCTPFSADRVLVANSDCFFLLKAAQDRNADGTPWPTFKYANSDKPWPEGLCTWDGATRVGLAANQRRTVQMADFTDPTKPNLLWCEETKGYPENPVFHAGRLLVPCGYQGLLVEKRPECRDEIRAKSKIQPAKPVEIGELNWKLPKKFAVREGDTVKIDIPQSENEASALASADLDVSRFAGKYVRFRIHAKGEGLAKPKVSYRGLKFMLRIETEDGGKKWPAAGHRMGDWEDDLVVDCDFSKTKIKTASLSIGIQQCTGRVAFDLSTLKAEDCGDVFPSLNADFKAAYPRSLREGGMKRGVMLPGNLEKICEDDFATLGKWGATLARYQMAKNWKTVNGWENNEDYDEYINGALDILESRVLPWADKYGIKIVVDMHATPGARNEREENRIFFEKRYASHFVNVWKRIATRFKGDKRIFGYDLVNEPSQLGPAPFSYLLIQYAAAKAIRSVDPDATIIVAANGYGHPSGFKTLSPFVMDNVIYQTHCYAPMGFTHQGTHSAKREGLDPYPNPEKGWNKDDIKKALAPVLEFSRRHNAKIYVGEFSAITWAPGADQYIRDCIEIFEEYGWDWCYHAFREWDGWSVEKTWRGRKNNRDVYEPTDDDPRKIELLKGFRQDSAQAAPAN